MRRGLPCEMEPAETGMVVALVYDGLCFAVEQGGFYSVEAVSYTHLAGIHCRGCVHVYLCAGCLRFYGFREGGG